MSSNTDSKKLREFIEKVDSMKKQDKMDLSSDQDLSIAIMNLISIEEHFFFTGAKLGKTSYYDLVREAREMRKDLLKRIIKEYEGEVWCISKHLLSASMRLMEVGTKQLWMGRDEDAYDFFNKSYDLYSLFWGLNMGLVGTGDVEKAGIVPPKKESDDAGKSAEPKSSGTPSQSDETAVEATDENERKGFFSGLKTAVRKAIDCCIE